jgi:hypothetical protein
MTSLLVCFFSILPVLVIGHLVTIQAMVSRVDVLWFTPGLIAGYTVIAMHTGE